MEPGSGRREPELGRCSQECHFVPTEIRVYGDTALVIGKYDQKATYKGAPADEKGVFTDVFVKRNGKWLCVLGQSTPNGI